MGKYEIREMKAPDVFKLTSILSQVGVKNFIQVFKGNDTLSKLKDKKVSKEEKDELAIELAFGVVDVLLANLDKCEQPIYRFISSLCGVDKTEIENLKGVEFFNLLVEVFTQKDCLDFFKGAIRIKK